MFHSVHCQPRYLFEDKVNVRGRPLSPREGGAGHQDSVICPIVLFSSDRDNSQIISVQ